MRRPITKIHRILLCWLLLWRAPALGGDVRRESNQGRYDFSLQEIPVPQYLEPETNLSILPPTAETKNGRTSYLLTSTESFRVVVPSGSNGNKRHLEKTSKQSARNHCRFAANGGPFHADGTCAGAVLVYNNGTVVCDDFGSVGLGQTRDNKSWIIGSVDNQEQAVAELDLGYYVTGFDWLVYEGTNVAALFNNTTGADQAPRTAVGLTTTGILILMVTDGCQFCPHRRGLTLVQLADQMLHAGAAFAINMDGGSSSVLVESNLGVISRPTCLDLFPIRCEHPVASVLCIGHDQPSLLREM